MDPQLPPQTSFEVPSTRPAGDMVPLTPVNQESRPATPEFAPNPQTMPVQSQPQPLPQPSQMGAQQAIQTALPPVPQATPSIHPAAPAVADDLDLIEKEWVNKAKAIVAQTRTDPYAQNSEMNKFKADYMKKRYNKDIKIEN